MVINELHIAAFGGLTDRDISFDDGLNIIEGANESGKTSAAMFIKFIFYGLSGKSTGGAMSERTRYVNLSKSMAAGYLICTENGVKYRVERNLTVVGENEGAVRETVRIVNLSDGSIVNGVVPGEYFFGVNESLFVNTVFVGQLARIRPDGEGLGGAVENMLSSADENVNLKKAADRLNSARRELQHKNGNGGEIAQLKEERASLEKEANTASASAAELIEAEASLAEAIRKKEQLEKRKEKLDGIFKALDTILVKKKLDAVTHTEQKIARLKENVERIDRSGFLSQVETTLTAAEQDVRAYHEAAEIGREKLAFGDEADRVPMARAGEIPSEEELDDAFYLDSKTRIQFSVAVAMLIAAVLGLAASVLMYYYNTGSYLIPLVMTGICSFLGVVFFILRHRTLNHLYDMLDYWNVEDVEEMEDLSLNGGAVPAGDEGFVGEESFGFAPADSEKRYAHACEVIFAMASAIKAEPSEDPLEMAAAIRAYAEKLADDRENMKARMENFAGRLSVLKEQVASVDAEKAEKAAAEAAASPYGKLALSLDTEGIKKVIRERDFTHGAYQSQVKRVEELERACGELKLKAKSPAEAASRIQEIDELLRELELKRDGYHLAMDALKKAGENVRSNIVPSLTSYASEIMEKVVDGKYSSLILNSDFGMNYVSGGETRSTEHMSKGTYDAAYLSLRLALMKVVFKNAMPPLVLDESFAYIDEERMIRLLGCIAEGDGQSLFFTCRERETAEAHKAELRCNFLSM